MIGTLTSIFFVSKNSKVSLEVAQELAIELVCQLVEWKRTRSTMFGTYSLIQDVFIWSISKKFVGWQHIAKFMRNWFLIWYHTPVARFKWKHSLDFFWIDQKLNKSPFLGLCPLLILKSSLGKRNMLHFGK